MVNLSDIGPAPSTKVDPAKYSGKRVKVASVSVEKDITDYDEEGKFVQGLGREVDVVKMTTESIGTNEAGEQIYITEKVNLKKLENGKVVWSTHPKAGMMKLFAKYKINRPEELIGREVMLIERVSTNNPDKRWLGFETA